MANAFMDAMRAHRAARASRGRTGTTLGGAEAPGAQQLAATTSAAGSLAPPTHASSATPPAEAMVDLARRRDELNARVAELQWDLGGLVYEMAIRDNIKLDVLVRRAAMLQDADAELGEVERMLRMEQTAAAGACAACGALHSRGAVYCWQCGQALLVQVPSQAIASS